MLTEKGIDFNEEVIGEIKFYFEVKDKSSSKKEHLIIWNIIPKRNSFCLLP